MTFYCGGLYLVGYCHLRREVRIFAIERIRAVTALREIVKPADFDAKAYLRGAWGIVRGDLVAVCAVFSRAAAPHVRGRLWHASQEVREWTHVGSGTTFGLGGYRMENAFTYWDRGTGKA